MINDNYGSSLHHLLWELTLFFTEIVLEISENRYSFGHPGTLVLETVNIIRAQTRFCVRYSVFLDNSSVPKAILVQILDEYTSQYNDSINDTSNTAVRWRRETRHISDANQLNDMQKLEGKRCRRVLSKLPTKAVDHKDNPGIGWNAIKAHSLLVNPDYDPSQDHTQNVMDWQARAHVVQVLATRSPAIHRGTSAELLRYAVKDILNIGYYRGKLMMIVSAGGPMHVPIAYQDDEQCFYIELVGSETPWVTTTKPNVKIKKPVRIVIAELAAQKYVQDQQFEHQAAVHRLKAYQESAHRSASLASMFVGLLGGSFNRSILAITGNVQILTSRRIDKVLAVEWQPASGAEDDNRSSDEEPNIGGPEYLQARPSTSASSSSSSSLPRSLRLLDMRQLSISDDDSVCFKNFFKKK
jgi:hypothetical protein